MTVVRSSALFAVVGLLVLSFPHSARGDEPNAIAGLSGIGVLSTILCSAAAYVEARGERSDADSESKRKEYARRGVLVGAALAYAVETYESDVQSSLRNVVGEPLNLSVKNSFGFKGRVGYRCLRYASAELQVEWLDSFDGKVFEDGVGRVATFDVEPVVITANIRGYVPIGSDRLQPFALLGGGVVTLETKVRDTTGLGLRESSRDTDFAIRAGGGVDFYATPNIVLTFETDYVHAFGALDDFAYVSIGLGVQYRF